MSMGKDVIAVVKSGQEVYKAAKAAKKSLADEDKVAKGEIDRVKTLSSKLGALLADLPDSMNRSEQRKALAETKKLVKARLKEQQIIQDFEEIGRLNSQLFVLGLAESKLSFLETFDASALVDKDSLATLRQDVEDVQSQIATQLKIKAFYRISIRLAIFAIDLGMLLAKAAI